MVIIALIILINLMPTSNGFCATDDTGLNICHDGGCNYINPNKQICDCHLAKHVMSGKYCGVYDDKCLGKEPCGYNSTCQSGIGHHICTCDKNRFGINCELSIIESYPFEVLKRPSVYYRIKSKQGEVLYMLVVAETFGNDTFDVLLNGILTTFRFNLNDFRRRMKVSDAVELCSTKLNSETFKINNCNGPDTDDCQNMCDFIPKIYGNDNEVDVALIGPYFHQKTARGKEDIFFNDKIMGLDRNPMGSQYDLKVRLKSKTYESLFHLISYIQFIVEDELYKCVPFIERSLAFDPITSNHGKIEKVERSCEKWFTKIIVKPDNVCKKPNYTIEEQSEWKIFQFNKTVQSYANDEGFISVTQEDPEYLKFKLPQGLYIMYYQITITDLNTGSKSSNSYLRYVEISLLKLVAKINGPYMVFLEDKLLTLDASQSYNPNENENDSKKNLLYTWTCNIKADEMCKNFTTKESKVTFDKYLNKAHKYLFTLTLSVDNDYSIKVGIPKEGRAEVSVISTFSTTTLKTQTSTLKTTQTSLTSISTIQTSTLETIQTSITPTSTAQTSTTKTSTIQTSTIQTSTIQTSTQKTTQTSLTPTVTSPILKKTTVSNLNKKISLECIKNCDPLSNPSDEIHLETKINFIGNEFEWYYQMFDDTNLSSVIDITLTDVPIHMLIVKKNMLNYGTTYNFIIKYPKYALINHTSITTISRPKYGNCSIEPRSGFAWTTSFTITCINFNNENKFEYYQKNKNDNSTMGVLLDQGNGTTTDIKLTSSNYLTVNTLNKYGASIQERLTVNVTECDTNLLNKLFHILRSYLKKKKKSKAVSLIAILSDVLHDNRIQKFHKLFKALKKLKFSKIPLNNYIFSIEQFVLILQKVINDFYESKGNKFEKTDLVTISKPLLKAIYALFDFIKISNDDDKMIEIDRVERIKKELRKNMIFIQNNIMSHNEGPIIINDTGRYFWSSIDKLKLMTQNIEEFIKTFGISVIIDLLPYERPIACHDESKEFKSCILTPKWVTNQSSQWNSHSMLFDTIGETLSNELLMKGGNWGVTKCDIANNNLIQSFDQANGSQIVMPIVSLDIVRVDGSIPKNIIKHDRFESFIDLNFKTNDTIKRPRKNYTIPVHTGNNNGLEFDKTILVYKIDMQNIGELFVTLSDSTHDLRFAWFRDNRPDKAIMMNDAYSMKLEAGKTNKFTLRTLGTHRDEMHYIGIAANTNERITQNFSVNFSMDMDSQKCLYWTGAKWASDGITVGPKTTENNIQCQVNHMSLFSGLMYTLPDVVNPIEEFSHVGDIEDGIICLLAVAALFVVYIVLLVWSKYQDNKDILRGEIIVLHDNYPGEDEVYVVTVYTGHYSEAGTTANVCVQLHGSVSTSRAHWLYNFDCDVLQRFSDDWFIIFTPKSLGELQYIRIWSDNYGNRPNWYCKRIEVTDVRKQKSWNFNVERWFSLRNTEDSIVPQNLKKTALDDIELTIREEHLWASVFVRHPRSLLTRCQRLSKILCLLLCLMLISLMFYDFLEDDEEEFLNFEITLSQVSIAIQSSIIEAIMTFGTSYCFNKGQQFEIYRIISDRLEQQIYDRDIENIQEHRGILETWWKKIILMVVKKKPYFPARTENKVKKRTRINYWLIIGWTFCILIYVISASFIIAYGLKLGRVKSLHWLMTILITIIQSAFLVEPLKIIISSCILFKLNKEQNIITQYKIKLDDYRKNTKNLLQDLSLVQYIRDSRRRYVYNPLTRSDIQVLQHRKNGRITLLYLRENAITCILIILISACCISALYSFESPKYIIHANNLNKLFLKSLLQTDVMDLETLKTFLTESFVDFLHTKEYYNGISITNETKSYSNDARGWYSLYNSKLINGGIRLKQLRIVEKDLEWKIDKGNYNEGWIQTATTDDITPWSYTDIPVIKYFGLWFPETDSSGFILDLTGDLFEYKKILKHHLENGWLDNRTRNLIIEFQTFTPNIDSITVFNIKLHSESGLLYTVTTVVWTVPSSSVFIDWTTYAFTLVFVSAYTATAVRLTGSVTRMTTPSTDGPSLHDRFWTAYECALLAIVVTVSFAVAGRWRLMTVAGAQYSSARGTAYVASVTDMCRTHEHVAALASVAVAMALFRTFRLVALAERTPHTRRTLDASSGAVASVAAFAMVAAYGAWYGTVRPGGGGDGHGFLNAFVVGRHELGRGGAPSPPCFVVTAVAVFLFLNAAAVAIITKRYVVSKLHSPPATAAIGNTRDFRPFGLFGP